MAMTPVADLKPSLTDAPLGALTGNSSKGRFTRRTGKEITTTPPGCNIMLFGQQGTGKSVSVVHLLLLGYKVVYVQTDYGDSGFETVYNYFKTHPDKMHFFEQNFMMFSGFNFEGVVDFMKAPEKVWPEIYDWDPDVIMWDGVSSFQENIVEGYLAKNAAQLLSTDDGSFKDWKSARNGTVFPLDHFLRLYNRQTGKPWHKIATCLEVQDLEYKKVHNNQGKQDRDFVEGTEFVAPYLHTTAKKIATAGFGITIRTVKKFLGGVNKFSYEFQGQGLQTKDRNYGLPVKMDPADFGIFWVNYVQPLVGGPVMNEKKG